MRNMGKMKENRVNHSETEAAKKRYVKSRSETNRRDPLTGHNTENEKHSRNKTNQNTP